MNDFGNLGDFLPQTEVECRIHGCHNHVKISGEVAMQNIAHGRSPRPQRLCDDCYAKLQTLQDQEVPCSKPGCDGKWIWNRFQQLEAIVAGHTNRKPHGFCDKCREEMKGIQEEKFPCRMKGCKNTWTLSAREKLELNGKPAPKKLCKECFQKLNTLNDQEIKCRISGCDNTWTWNRFQQLEHILSGKTIENPPSRMCPDCAKLYASLAPKEIPCRIHGCTHTWTWSPFEQLEATLAMNKQKAEQGGQNEPAKPAEPAEPVPESQEAAAEQPAQTGPVPPSRMCKECYTLWAAAKDIEVPCKNQACKNSWIFTRSMQLSQKIKGFTTPPPRYCEACAKREKELEIREMPCSTPGCTGTWSYMKDEQLRDESYHREPNPRRCPKCKEFLKNNPVKEITCTKCGKQMKISSLQQLLSSLGNVSLPQMCADCTGQHLANEMPAEAAEANISRPAIYLPKSGPWLSVAEISSLPADATPAKIDAMGKSNARIVCIGDELTLAWPGMLQEALVSKFSNVQVLNAGIKGSSSEMCLVRLERDVLPYKPNLVIISSSFADGLSLAETSEETLAKLAETISAIFKKCLDSGAKVIYWTPNPIDFTQAPEYLQGKAAAFDAAVRTARKAAENASVPVVDVRALFGVNGEQTSRKWMENWFTHNSTGASNIANWLKDQILTENLLQESQPLA